MGDLSKLLGRKDVIYVEGLALVREMAIGYFLTVRFSTAFMIKAFYSVHFEGIYVLCKMIFSVRQIMVKVRVIVEVTDDQRRGFA